MQRISDYCLHILLIALTAMSTTLGCIYGVGLILSDRPVTLALSVVALSPVMMFVLRVIELLRHDGPESQVRSAVQIFNPHKQSWAFMFGDTFLLSFAMIALTNGWQYVPSDSWFNSWTWFAVSGALGIILSMIFAAFDWPRYLRNGSDSALISPTKVWHDWVVFPVLMSLLLFAGVPQIAGNGSFHTVMASVAICLFIGLGIADMVRDKRGTLNSDDQHLLWDPIEFRPYFV